MDDALGSIGGKSCTSGAGTTTCTFTNSASKTVKIDFASFANPTFSANTVALSCDLDCVADTNTELSTTALCLRVWVNNARHLIGKFTVRPTSSETGAGCFRILSGSDIIGVIYDKSSSTATTASNNSDDRPRTYLEIFADTSQGQDAHLFASETGATSSAQLINFHLVGYNTTYQSTQFQTSRWIRNVNLWYGNILINTDQSETNSCATKSGVTASGCSSSLTSPNLPSHLAASVTADTSWPSTSVFPSSPTF